MNHRQLLAETKAKDARAQRWNLMKWGIANYDAPDEGDVTLWMKIPFDSQLKTPAETAAEVHTYMKPAFTEQAFEQVNVTQEIEWQPVGGWAKREEKPWPLLKVVLSGEAAAEFRTQRVEFDVAPASPDEKRGAFLDSMMQHISGRSR